MIAFLSQWLPGAEGNREDTNLWRSGREGGGGCVAEIPTMPGGGQGMETPERAWGMQSPEKAPLPRAGFTHTQGLTAGHWWQQGAVPEILAGIKAQANPTEP